jgi:hypothetical protein
MHKTLLLIPLALCSALLASTLLPADEERGEREHERREQAFERNARSGGNRSDAAYLRDADYPRYQKQCGECHLAYPPSLLPQASWQVLLGGLGDHFGDNAEIDAQEAAFLQDYLARHAAGPGKGDYSERMWRATQGQATPRRISETDYFVGKHHEIPLKLVKDNPQVKSYSQCQACHVRADRGSFDEHEVRIPGRGRWED